MLLSCRSLASWVRRLVACMGRGFSQTLERVLRLPTFSAASVWHKHLSPSLSSRGCFGCYAKPTPITAVDEPSKRLRIQGRSISRKASLLEDFWSSSAREMENSAMQSQRSVSSISTAVQPNEQHCAGSSSNPSEFVNQGLTLWNLTRQQWVGNKKRRSRSQQPREPKLSWNATYESLLGSNKPFSQPIPLGEMVDLLVDTWEQEGLYD